MGQVRLAVLGEVGRRIVIEMRTRWISACGAGEAAGIAVVATVYAALDRGLISGAVPWILAAGAWEGLCLGAFQATQLRRMGISSERWIGFTVLGALLGYGLSLLGGAGSQGEADAEPAISLILILGAGMGVVMGALMGALQSFAGRNVLNIGRWTLANTGGWAVAMVVIMFAASSVQSGWPLGAIAVVGAVSGGIAGLALGAVTSLALPAAVGRAG